MFTLLNHLHYAKCPAVGSVPSWHPVVPGISPTDAQAYAKAVQTLDIQKVKADIKAVLTQSQSSWPADYGNYGPLMVRLAWHTSGSYRLSDGRGGADGGRQRFDPERSWPDNTNLDKARKLLWPIKLKYGAALSWGDLTVLAGTTAIEAMGGPVLGFCAGRIDDENGAESVELGPSAEQEQFHPCPVNGKCTSPLGASTVGLIYVNPEGPMGEPLPAKSALDVRDTFARMGMNDSETVALIGGGHAFGKTHGACPEGAGASPHEDPANPWPGKCGTGKGKDTFTSGFEGSWSSTPTQWSNKYFKYLTSFQWEAHTGPGGHTQWRAKPGVRSILPKAPAAHERSAVPTMMLTSDVSLLHDPAGKYQQLVQIFASDQAQLDHAFSHAWYKLTTRDMGPASRCSGDLTPPPQPFQFPLPPPPPPAALADFGLVSKHLRTTLRASRGRELCVSWAHLAWRCASTFRTTDYRGGCNGARIRFAPERDWTENVGIGEALQTLEPVKAAFPDGLSWSDLIVLAGQVAVEEAGGPTMPFCGGRTDAVDGAGSADLEPEARLKPGTVSSARAQMVGLRKRLGLTVREVVILHAWPRTGTVSLSNAYFRNLLAKSDAPSAVSPTSNQPTNSMDELIRTEPEYLAVAQSYASDGERFLKDFVAAWLKVMNLDRFDGPLNNVCYRKTTSNCDEDATDGKAEKTLAASNIPSWLAPVSSTLGASMEERWLQVYETQLHVSLAISVALTLMVSLVLILVVVMLFRSRLVKRILAKLTHEEKGLLPAGEQGTGGL
mmetsp:Transcript_75732/g.126274  ORF Transcript_75732/g.126274 Transcript_75732/m.126274 type:complete len:780 (+) Transcript_75732:20-2359(+)